MRKNIEARMKTKEELRKELETVRVSIVFIIAIFAIIRCSNLWLRKCDINENCYKAKYY
jgi:hypothetical protein